MIFAHFSAKKNQASFPEPRGVPPVQSNFPHCSVQLDPRKSRVRTNLEDEIVHTSFHGVHVVLLMD